MIDLENWNFGKQEFGESYLPIIPSFHYSIIPGSFYSTTGSGSSHGTLKI
jgi:hypothetical protein